MNCFNAHFQTLFQYFFGTFHIVLSIYFVHFIRIFLPYSLQSCILLTSDAANFIPDTIILNLQPWNLNFYWFSNFTKISLVFVPHKFEKILQFFCPRHKSRKFLQVFVPMPKLRDKFFRPQKCKSRIVTGGGASPPVVTKRLHGSSWGGRPPPLQSVFLGLLLFCVDTLTRERLDSQFKNMLYFDLFT